MVDVLGVPQIQPAEYYEKLAELPYRHPKPRREEKEKPKKEPRDENILSKRDSLIQNHGKEKVLTTQNASSAINV